MKQFFVTILAVFIGLQVFASNEEDVRKFFNKYIYSANSYSNEISNFYSSNAEIIRQVVKPNGQLVNVNFTFEQYKNQMKISAKIAKMKNYKNKYSNITIKKLDAKTYQIDAYRQPSTGGDKLKVSTIVEQQANGNWLITKELMQTKEQVFLKYAK